MGMKAHLFSEVLAAVILVFSAVCLTNGQGVMTMRSQDKELRTVAGPVQLHSLVGYPYTFGAIHDQYGNRWEDKKNPTDHPAHFISAISCNQHIRLGKGLQGSIACTVLLALFLLLVSFAGVLNTTFDGVFFTARCNGILAVATSALLTVSFVLNIGILVDLYSGAYPCGMFKSNVRISLQDYFELGLIAPFVVAGVFGSIISVLVHICTGSLDSMQDTPTNIEEPIKPSPIEGA